MSLLQHEKNGHCLISTAPIEHGVQISNPTPHPVVGQLPAVDTTVTELTLFVFLASFGRLHISVTANHY